MNKRSAMLMAAGLVLTMMLAGVAITAGLTGPSTGAAAPRAAQQRAPKPLVKTIRSTRTVHKKASQGTAGATSSGGVPVVQAVSSPRSSASIGSYEDDHGHEEDVSHAGGGEDD